MDLEELARRLIALEEQVGMEAGLRASGDRDLADLAKAYGAQRHLVQALAITQGEHTDKLREILATQAAHTEALSSSHEKLNIIIEMLNRLQG